MITISLCMIVKNEEETLARCLDSAEGVFDELVIADTGSTDATKGIARRYTPLAFDFAWIDDFSAARNFAFSKATKDYILWLDADDVLLPEDRERFLELKNTLDPSVDAVMMKYNIGFDDAGRVTFSYFRERLARRACGFLWMEPVHEYLAYAGKVIYSDVAVTHRKPYRPDTGRNLAIYEKQLASGRPLTPRGQYYYARELKDSARYEEAARCFTEFLDGGMGWLEDNINACAELAVCYERMARPEQALAAHVRAFSYDLPRAEACCKIAYIYKEKMDYPRAAFWFELATRLKKPEGSLGFFQQDYWDYIPALELCVCFDKLGERARAEEWNRRAAAVKPESRAVEFNRKYFDDLREKGML